MNRDRFIDRIKEVIKYYSLTSSTFADIINVPKSSISHLMSGRNKPSLDFVLKIIDQFPEVDLYWLLNGEGSFPQKKEKAQESKITEFDKEVNLASQFNEDAISFKSTDTPTLFSDTKFNSSVVKKSTEGTDKKLIKVILLYNDGSFDEFKK